MISAIALLIAFIILIISLLIGGGITAAGFISVRKKEISIGCKILIWFAGALPAAILWIIFIKLKVNFSSPGGPPTEEDWKNMFLFFSMAALLPGVCLSTGGIAQIIGGSFLKNSGHNTLE